MVTLKDNIGRKQECKYLIEAPSFQPATQEILYQVIAVGYDGIRRTVLFTFFNEEECREKYMELYEKYMNQMLKEMST